MSLGRTASLGRTGRNGRSRPGRLIAVTILAILGLAAVAVPALAASSSTSAGVPTVVLCGGYHGCDRAGYNSYGYSRHSRTSYWRMYAGDECTNYVAYVEATHFGVATPGYLLGNAYQWPATARAHGVRVNKTPSVGSVAVWPGGAYGIGPDGHVAVVEKVGPRHSYIVVSQQHLLAVANGYEWTRINAGFSSRVWEPWPSFFIHFRLRRHIPGALIAGLHRHRATKHRHARKRHRARRHHRTRQRQRARHHHRGRKRHTTRRRHTARRHHRGRRHTARKRLRSHRHRSRRHPSRRHPSRRGHARQRHRARQRGRHHRARRHRGRHHRARRHRGRRRHRPS